MSSDGSSTEDAVEGSVAHPRHEWGSKYEWSFGARLVSFFLILTVVSSLAALAGPLELPWNTLPILFGGLMAGWVALWMEGRKKGALGFYLSSGILGELIRGLGLGFLIAGVAVLAIFLFGGLSWTPQTGSIRTLAGSLLAGLGLFILPAAAEEVIFRGYPLQALARRFGAAPGLFLTSGVFGALHVINPNLSFLGVANILVAGLLLGVVFIRTGSLWWATGVHLGWNWTIGSWADLPVSGLELIDTPFWTGATSGPVWLSGGEFGPEGSLVATVVLLGATVVLWRGRWLMPSAGALKAGSLITEMLRHGIESGQADEPMKGIHGMNDRGDP